MRPGWVSGRIEDAMSNLVVIENLDFSYAEQPVLRQITLEVESGTTLGVIGPNGGGKTTLMRLLLGLLKPTAGSIRIDGLTPAAAVARGDLIGYLPQALPEVDRFPLTVRQVVELGLAGKAGLLRSPVRADTDFLATLIERVGLGHLADRNIARLSGGQLQRVFIAKALAARPRLLILDEPTTAIDRSAQQRIIEMIGQLKRELSLTIILISHDLRAVGAISDRIACLNGTLHYHDVPQHLPADLMFSMFACDLEAMGLNQSPVPLSDATFTPMNVAIRQLTRPSA